MIGPLVYVFAVAAFLVAGLFSAAALLAFKHARRRSGYADALLLYVAPERVPDVEVSPAGRDVILLALSARKAVMHLTIGDLVRDAQLGAAARSAAAIRSAQSEGPHRQEPPPDTGPGVA